MSVRSIAIIGKNTTSSSTRTNEEPVLYIREFTTTTTGTTTTIVSSSTERHDPTELLGHNISNNNNNDNDEFELFGLHHLRSSLPSTTSTTAAASSSTEKGRSSTGSSSLLFTGCSIRQQFILHAALDRFDELNGPPPGCFWRHTNNTTTIASHLSAIPESAMFVGLLYPIEDMRVYGYQTTTQIRFLITIEDDWNHNNNLVGSSSIYNYNNSNSSSSNGNNIEQQQQRILEETSILRLFIQLHRIYVEYILNPFSNINGPIQSKQFDIKINNCIQSYNNNKQLQ